jgi:hypothetical protein
LVLSGGQLHCAPFISVISKLGAIPKEGGLLGSQAVAQDYKKKGINVIAMSQVGLILRDVSATLLIVISSSI